MKPFALVALCALIAVAAAAGPRIPDELKDEPKLFKGEGKHKFNAESKNAFPDLVGLSGEDAISRIQAERPELRQVITVNEFAPVTRDLRRDRVRVFINDAGEVVKTPRVG
jgi:hypothetical protein